MLKISKGCMYLNKGLKILIWIIVIFVILGIGGCVATIFIAKEAVNVVDEAFEEIEKEQEEKDKLLQKMFEKAKVKENKDEYTYEVIYEVTNDTDVTFEYIEVEYSMYDKNGTKLGSSFTNITNIAPNQKFQVKLDLYEEGTASYKIDKISSTAL